VWDRRAGTWEHHGAVGLEPVIDAVLDAAAGQPGMMAVDLGCGTGQLSIPLAARGLRVTAVDVSPQMVGRLRAKVDDMELDGIVHAAVAPIERVSFTPGSLDLVVSNYALHHLRNGDKQALVGQAARWLRPGGRLVVGDMMFGRGATPRDRAIIGSKVVALAKKGPAGWWRVAKNMWRFLLRLQERPCSIDTWRHYFEQAGFSSVSATEVVSEAAVMVGIRP
jgi:ubiquinone/menaquinone biosynthesis C-methylase UbiE